MKRKASVLLIGIITVCLIVGISIYINVMKRDSQYGLILETKHISSECMTLCLEYKGEDKSLSVGDRYRIQKFTFLGWKQVHERPPRIESEKWEDFGDYFMIWDLNWKREVGKLPLGIYRIEKEILTSQNEKIILYAPFLCGGWWLVLLGVLATTAIVVSVKFGKRHVIDKKKKIIYRLCMIGGILISLAVLFLYCYERRIVSDDVLIPAGISLEESARMQIYDVSGYAWVNNQVKEVEDEEKIMALTSEQRMTVQKLLGKCLNTYRRLWYRYDAVIVIDGKVRYMVNIKDEIVMINYEHEYGERIECAYMERGEREMWEKVLRDKR